MGAGQGRWLVGVLLAVVGCQGRGSDIGPRLDVLPDASFKVQVLDAQGRGVCAARVTVQGVPPAVTGRSGRADLLASPRGRRLVTVDATAGSAIAGDRLGAVTFAADLDRDELPGPVFVPDLAGSAGLTVPTGVQAGTSTLDDSASSGAVLTIGAGSAVSDGGAASVTLRTGSLGAGQVSGSLPAAAQPWLVGRAVLIDPPGATFAPPATLRLPDDLQVGGGGTAVLLFLDPELGQWVQAGTGTEAGGQLTATGAVARGGHYAFATAVAASAGVRGRVLDERGRALAGVLVRAETAMTVTGGDGRFLLDGLAATLGNGGPRPVAVALRGGRTQLPVGASFTTNLAAGSTADLGDLTLATVQAGDVRVLQVRRGRAEVHRRASLGSLDGAVSLVGITDHRGAHVFEEVPSEYYGFVLGYPLDSRQVNESAGVAWLPPGRLRTDISQFYDDPFWFSGSRNTRTRVMDWLAGGPMRGAVVRGSTAGEGFVDVARESGLVFAGRDFSGRATATAETSSGGVTVVSAFSIERPNGEHLDMPLRRALRPALGAFDRHGLITGTLTGGTAGRQHRVISTRVLEPGEWFDDVFLGQSIASSVPLKADPGTGLTFRVGVAAPEGQLAVAEGTLAGPVFTMERLGLLLDQVVPEGAEVARDLPLDRAANAAFPAPGALANGGGGDLRLDLGLLRPDGTAVDVARQLGGNHLASGPNVTFLLPALDAGLQDHAWLLALSTGRTEGADTLRHRTLMVAGPGGITPRPFLLPPTVTAPVAGSQFVASDGLAVAFALPAGSFYGTLELRSTDPGSELSWLAVVPPETTSFVFPRLPTQAATPLRAGRAYTLTVTAFRADAGPLLQSPQPYRDLTTFWHAVDAYERGVTAMASRSFAITSAP